jgi:hypothetical protein
MRAGSSPGALDQPMVETGMGGARPRAISRLGSAPPGSGPLLQMMAAAAGGGSGNSSPGMSPRQHSMSGYGGQQQGRPPGLMVPGEVGPFGMRPYSPSGPGPRPPSIGLGMPYGPGSPTGGGYFPTVGVVTPSGPSMVMLDMGMMQRGLSLSREASYSLAEDGQAAAGGGYPDMGSGGYPDMGSGGSLTFGKLRGGRTSSMFSSDAEAALSEPSWRRGGCVWEGVAAAAAAGQLPEVPSGRPGSSKLYREGMYVWDAVLAEAVRDGRPLGHEPSESLGESCALRAACLVG